MATLAHVSVLLLLLAASVVAQSERSVPEELLRSIASSPPVTEEAAKNAVSFWTEERRAAARGHPALLSGGDPQRINGPPHPEVVKMLEEAGLLDAATNSTGRRARQYVDTTGLPNGSSRIAFEDYDKYPFKAEGKVFGKHPILGYTFVCSGALVGSNVVMTAGHCCSSNGIWMTDLVLFTEYQDGCGPGCSAVPLGKANSPSGWVVYSYWQYDYCFAHVQQGSRPSLPLAVSVTQSRIYLACGYPTNTAEKPGAYLWCTRNAQSTSEKGSKGIPSKLGEGASGGPWTIGSNITEIDWGTPDTNHVNGLNSHIYPGKLVMYSPNFDSLTAETYRAASRGT